VEQGVRADQSENGLEAVPWIAIGGTIFGKAGSEQ
jgi:hypothetical protein